MYNALAYPTTSHVWLHISPWQHLWSRVACLCWVMHHLLLKQANLAGPCVLEGVQGCDQVLGLFFNNYGILTDLLVLFIVERAQLVYTGWTTGILLFTQSGQDLSASIARVGWLSLTVPNLPWFLFPKSIP